MLKLSQLKVIPTDVSIEIFDIILKRDHYSGLANFYLGRGSTWGYTSICHNQKVSLKTLNYLNSLGTFNVFDTQFIPLNSTEALEIYKLKKDKIYYSNLFQHLDRDEFKTYFLSLGSNITYDDLYICFHAHIFDFKYLHKTYGTKFEDMLQVKGISNYVYHVDLSNHLNLPIFNGFTKIDLDLDIKNAFEYFKTITNVRIKKYLTKILFMPSMSGQPYMTNVFPYQYGHSYGAYPPNYEFSFDYMLNFENEYINEILNSHIYSYEYLDKESQKIYIKFILDNSDESSIKNASQYYMTLLKEAKDKEVIDYFYDEVLKSNDLLSIFAKYMKGMFLRLILDPVKLSALSEYDLKTILINDKLCYYIFCAIHSTHALARKNVSKNVCFGNFWPEGCKTCLYHTKMKVLTDTKICRENFVRADDITPARFIDSTLMWINNTNIQAYQTQSPLQAPVPDKLHVC